MYISCLLESVGTDFYCVNDGRPWMLFVKSYRAKFDDDDDDDGGGVVVLVMRCGKISKYLSYILGQNVIGTCIKEAQLVS